MSDRVDGGISWPAARPEICDICPFRSRTRTVLVMDVDLFQDYGGRAARVHAGSRPRRRQALLRRSDEDTMGVISVLHNLRDEELSTDRCPVFEELLLSTSEGLSSTPPRRPVG
jgi:hypothetical protein